MLTNFGFFYHYIVCKLDIMPKGFRVQVKYFGDNISKPVFCTLYYIISGSARSLTVLLPMMLSVISWLVGLLSYWLLPYQ